MQWDFEHLPCHNCLRIEVKGAFTLADQALLFEELAALEEFPAGLHLLFDNRLLVMKDVNSEVIRRSVQIMQSFSRRNSSIRIAGLVNEGINFGLGRQFETFTEIEGEGDFRIFKDEKLALQWLCSSAADES